MKKFNLIATSMVIMLVGLALTNCKKTDSIPESKQYVSTIDASFTAVRNVNITFKSGNDPNPFAAPAETQRTWSMLSNNPVFYTNGRFELIDGREFIVGSIAHQFWSNSANNPVTFQLPQGVYSNQTPDENVRVISEGKDAQGIVNYLGITDFNPSSANFPLAVNEFRLGDVLTLNSDALTVLPGGRLTISVTFGLALLDLVATKSQLSLSNNMLGFSDIKYGVPVSTTVTVLNNATTPIAPVLDVPLYFGTGKKVIGVITVTIVENYTGLDGQPKTATITKTVDANPNGQGMKMVLSTTKIGWFDSNVIAMSANDIVITTKDIPVN